MLDNHTKLILEAHRFIVKFISPSAKGFPLYLVASLHTTWKGLSIDMYLVVVGNCSTLHHMPDYHTKLILEAHRLIVKFISPSGKGFFFYVLASLHSPSNGLSIDTYLVVVGNCCSYHHMLENHTKLILEAHRLIVKFISPSGKAFFLYVSASLHSSWKGLSIDMHLVMVGNCSS